MTELDIYRALTEIMHDVFLRDDIVLTPTLAAKDVAGWDSFKQIEIVIRHPGALRHQDPDARTRSLTEYRRPCAGRRQQIRRLTGTVSLATTSTTVALRTWGDAPAEHCDGSGERTPRKALESDSEDPAPYHSDR